MLFLWKDKLMQLIKRKGIIVIKNINMQSLVSSANSIQNYNWIICTSWYIFLFNVLINFHKNIYPKSLFGDPSSGIYIHNYNYFHLIRNKSRNLSATNYRIYVDLPIIKIKYIKHRILHTLKIYTNWLLFL